MKTKTMKTIILLILLSVSGFAHAQIEKVWETNHPVGNDSLEVLFYKQDSSGNHYTGGSIGRVFFITKFNALGVHQWTVSDDKLIDKKIASYETENILRSRVSDIAFKGNWLYFSGSKHYTTQGDGCFNFILTLDTSGDSVAFSNVLKEDVFRSQTWDASGHRPLIRFVDNQLYFFTSFHNLTNPPLGNEIINIFKYDESLNLLKYKVFDGAASGSKDQIADVKIINSSFLISSLSGSRQRTLVCDTASILIWEKYHFILGTAKHSILPSIIKDSTIHTFGNFRDTARKDTQSGLGYKIQGHVRKYDFSGNLLDSLIISKSISSNDSLTDAIINTRGNIYAASMSKDSSYYKVLVTKINPSFQIEKQILIGEKPMGDIQLESDGCRLYLSFIDNTNAGTVLKLLRLDEDLNVLSEEKYHAGKNKVNSLAIRNKQISLLSSGKNIFTDTLSLKQLRDTINISEPVVLNVTAINPGSIVITWQFSNGLNDSVFIYKSLNGNDWQLFKVLSSLETGLSDSSLTPSSRYYYSIRSKWQNEYSCDELFASDSTPFNTDISFIGNNNNFQIYPNPVIDNLQIKGTADVKEVEILTVTGKVIRHYRQKENIAVNDLIPGFYFVRINKTYTYKIIKI